MDKRIISVLGVLGILISGVLFAARGADVYTLGSGDRIRIHVFGEDDLTIETLVSDSGTIAYPFLDEVKVSGQTVPSLQEYITSKLKGDYLINPVVTIAIIEYRQFYVSGRVGSPGAFPFQPGMTVRKAISLAGGFEERANKGKIFVVRDASGSSTPIPVKLDDNVKPGDIITVDRSFF